MILEMRIEKTAVATTDSDRMDSLDRIYSRSEKEENTLTST